MNVDIESLHKILKHPIRRGIVLELHEKHELAYIDLMNLLEVKNTGKFNYHLKILGDLIDKDEYGKYRLTEKGELASQLLTRFPEKTFKPKPLRGGDAILIGSVGFLLAFSNPGFFGLALFGIGIGLLGLVYALMAPGGVMWYLTVKRTNSNDLYDLFKPPLVTSALFVLSVVIMIILYIKMSFTFSIMLACNTAFLFLGVGIFEIISRAKLRI